jgi:serine/threonine protein kinase
MLNEHTNSKRISRKPVYKVFEVDGVPWLAMELAEGRTLRDVIASDAPLPTRDVLVYAANLAEALHAAHGKRILHRDVKPGNVMICREGRARLSVARTGPRPTPGPAKRHLLARGRDL